MKREEGRERGGLARNRRRSQKTKLVFWGGWRCVARLQPYPKKKTPSIPPACAVRTAQVGGEQGSRLFKADLIEVDAERDRATPGGGERGVRRCVCEREGAWT